jgi:hypothetical protein
MSVSKKWAVLSGAALAALSISHASAAVTIIGTTPYSNSTGGYTGNSFSVASGGPNAGGTGGVAVGNGRYWYTPSTNITTGWVFSPSGTTPLVLPPANPGTASVVKSINTNGTLIAGLVSGETVWTASGVPIPMSTVA